MLKNLRTKNKTVYIFLKSIVVFIFKLPIEAVLKIIGLFKKTLSPFAKLFRDTHLTQKLHSFICSEFGQVEILRTYVHEDDNGKMIISTFRNKSGVVNAQAINASGNFF